MQGAPGRRVSLWWRWLAAGGNGERAPQLWAGEEPDLEPRSGLLELELELEIGLGLELGLGLGVGVGVGVESGSGQERREQPCGLRHCFGLHHHLHLLPEEAAGLMWLSVSALLLIGRAEAVAKEVLGYRGH